jgi:hypothetical protein
MCLISKSLSKLFFGGDRPVVQAPGDRYHNINAISDENKSIILRALLRKALKIIDLLGN